MVRFDIVFYVRMKDGLIGLSNELPEHDEKYELHRLLGALLSKQLSVDEKLVIIEFEYDIPVEAGIRKEVYTMCNLSQGIREDAQAEFIINMYRKGYTLEQMLPKRVLRK